MADQGHREEDGWNSNAPWTEKVKFHEILAKRRMMQSKQDLDAAKRLIERSKRAFASSTYHAGMAGAIRKEHEEPGLKK